MIELVTAVFVCVYLGMALGRWPGLMLDRTGIALVGAIVLILCGAVTGEEVRAAIDVPTLVILFGLMVLSAQYASSGFYAWCSRRIAGAALGPAALLALIVAISGVLSAVLANDVVVFAMTPMLATGLLRRGLSPALPHRADRCRQCRLRRHDHRQPAEHPDRAGGAAGLSGVPRGLRAAGGGGARHFLSGGSGRVARQASSQDPRVQHGAAESPHGASWTGRV